MQFKIRNVTAPAWRQTGLAGPLQASL